MEELDKIREKIDAIDKIVAKLLVARFLLCIQTRSFKKSLRDRRRESEILQSVQNNNPAHKSSLKKIFKKIIKESVCLQKK